MLGRTFLLSFMFLALAGCTSLRLHEAGRSETAQEALDLAKEIQGEDTGVFDTMHDNIDAIATVRQKAQQKLNDVRYDSFMFAVAEMTADDVLEELTDALVEHREILVTVDTGVKAARTHIADALARQKTISEIVKVECVAPKDSIECLIASIDKRLDWLESNLEKLEKAIDGASGNDQSASSAIAPDAAGEHELGKIKEKIEEAREVLEAPLEDPQVKAAQNLLIRAGQELTLLEQERLLEFRRHLSAIERIQAEMTGRHVAYMDELMLSSLAAVDVDKAVEEAEIRQGGPLEENEKTTVAKNVAQWNKGDENERDFSQYLEASLARGAVDEFGRISVDLVQSFAAILFVEQYRDEQVALALATEQHRHSINLSEINLRQNMDLVHQITEALQIYYKGGIKPEELAEIIILSSQVAALIYIGSEI